LPAIFYLGALLSFRAAFARIGNGEFFHPIVSQSLERVGMAVAGGAVMGLVGVPNLLRLAGDAPGYLVAPSMSARWRLASSAPPSRCFPKSCTKRADCRPKWMTSSDADPDHA
jgi:hypothetical protein